MRGEGRRLRISECGMRIDRERSNQIRFWMLVSGSGLKYGRSVIGVSP